MPPHTDQARWFSEEIQPHDAQLKAYLRGAFPAVRDVEDVVQESFLRVWRRQLARPIASARGFLFQVARHVALDELRHDRASPLREAADAAWEAVPEDRASIPDTVCTAEEADLLFAAIDALPARCREIVILRKIEGLAQREIAARLGLSESTVQVQASRGLRRCAEFLRAHGAQRGGEQ